MNHGWYMTVCLVRCRLLMREVINCGILEGAEGHMIFSASLQVLSMGKFKLFGQLLQWSVMHGGPGAPVFHKSFYNLATGQTNPIEIDTLPDQRVHDMLTAVSNAIVYIVVLYKALLAPEPNRVGEGVYGVGRVLRCRRRRDAVSVWTP